MSEAAVSSLERDRIVQAVIGMNDSPAEQSDGASRRSVVLVTGMSGSGKSTVLAELKRRGHRVIDTDDAGWIVETRTVGGPEPVWDLEQIKTLIDDQCTGWLFIAGCVANQGAVYHRFDAVVLLSAPVDVILDRVADRANPFGSTAEDRTKIAKDLAAFEPLLRVGGSRDRRLRRPSPKSSQRSKRVASGAGRRDPLRSRTRTSHLTRPEPRISAGHMAGRILRVVRHCSARRRRPRDGVPPPR